MKTKEIIKYGLLICGLINVLSVLVVTRLFTDLQVTFYQPYEINPTTLVVIILFGFVFLTVSTKIQFIPKLLLVLFAEKFTFFYIWAVWIRNHYFLAGEMLKNDFLSGLFQLIYGINDLFWALFFLWSFYELTKKQVKEV